MQLPGQGVSAIFYDNNHVMKEVAINNGAV